MKVNVNNFLAQEAAAAEWVAESRDRLLRHGAQQLDHDYFQMTQAQWDAYMAETPEFKKSSIS